MSAPVEHVVIEDPSGFALRCSCGQWAMLYRNAFGLDATEEHRKHVASATVREVAQLSIDERSSVPVRSLPADDVLVWATERRHGMRVHDPERAAADWPHVAADGERLTAGDARRGYVASFCAVCWPHPDDVAVRDVAE